MGTKYSTNSTTGYNATPPPDDGTVSEANKGKYSTIKTKLADPIKNLADTINSELVTHFDTGPIAITTSTTLDASHFNKIIQVSGSGVTLTLSDANSLTAGWFCNIISTDTTNSAILARATASNTINETSADVTILSLQSIRVIVNAAANGFLVDLQSRHSKEFKLSNASIIDANASIAAHATTMNPWSLGNYVTATGTAVTFTDLADAPQAGAEAEIYMNAAHIWTNNANLEVDGDANWTAEVGDRVLARAKAVTGPFTIRPIKKTGYAVITTVGNHSVVVHTGNGWGSTNIMIRRYTTVLTNVGTAITYADSAANGASFTINETGIYNLFMSDIRDAAVEIFGASVNSSQLSTYIENIDIANRVMMGEENVLARMGNCSITRRFSSGDVIRPHGDGNSGNTTNKVFFSVVKVGT